MSVVNLQQYPSMEHMAIQNPSAKTKLSFAKKITYLFTHLTLEPLVFIYCIGSMMNALTSQNLQLEKACRVNLQFNTSICDAMVRRNKSGYAPYQEEQVQQLVSKMVAMRSVFIGSLPPILMLFFGSWSDRHGRRKPVILLPIVGEFCVCIGLFFSSYFFYEIPIEVSALLESIPFSLSGAWFCAFLGIYSYVSGVSKDEERTIRIGAISMFQNVGMTMGIFLSGYLIKPIGFTGIYASTFVLITISLTYGFFMIKDNKIVPSSESKKSFLADFFDVGNVKTTFRTCFKGGSSNRKKKMIGIIIMSMTIMGSFFGEMSVLYLYTRLKFSWNEVDYSLYNTTHFLIQIFGSAFALTFFTKYLKMDDAMLGIIAIGSKLIACFVYALAPTPFYFYLGAFVEVFNGTVHIAFRSIMAKIVPPHELGQSNSVFGVCEAMMPLIFGPFYTFLYNYTINTFPSMFYFVSIFFYATALSIFIWLYRMKNEEDKLSKEIEKNIGQEENLLKKACSLELKKSMEKLKSNQSIHKTGKN